MALNFKAAESELQQLIKDNPSDDRIYILLHDITFNYLYNVLNPGSIYYDYEMIAWDLAADLFLRIRKGTRIEHFISYISYILKMYYLRNYEKNNWSLIIDTVNNAELEQSLKNSCVGNRNDDSVQLENLLTQIYCSQFESIITEVIKNTKFNFIDKDRLNLEISVLLTLIRKKKVYFRLPEHLQPYVTIIINQIRNKIIIDGICDRENNFTIKKSINNNDGSYIDDFLS